jgi:acyl carrier protein
MLRDNNSQPLAAHDAARIAHTSDENLNVQTAGHVCPAENGEASCEAALRAWLVREVAKVLQVSESDIDVDAPIDSFGLDSLVLFTMTGELAERLGRDLPATLLFEVPTINELVELLAPLAGSSACNLLSTPDEIKG